MCTRFFGVSNGSPSSMAFQCNYEDLIRLQFQIWRISDNFILIQKNSKFKMNFELARNLLLTIAENFAEAIPLIQGSNTTNSIRCGSGFLWKWSIS